jgi:hypothetical protein
MTPAELRALAKRVCEEQPSRELDAEIDALLTGRVTHPLLPVGYTMKAEQQEWRAAQLAQSPYISNNRGPALRYTTSLDAAASLIPQGWQPCLDMSIPGRCRASALGPRTHWITGADGEMSAGADWYVTIIAPTEPQARVAAALLAMAADMEASDA